MNAVQQFSLRGLFFVTLVAAVFCWMYVALPPAFWATLLWMLVVSAMFSASIYGPGNVRAFAVGCLPALAWWAVATGGEFYTPDPDGQFRFALVLFTVLSGCTSVCVQRWSVRSAKPAEMGTQWRGPDSVAKGPASAEPAGPEAEVAHHEKPADDDIFNFIEGNKRHWRCPACQDQFLSLQVQPACPRCGSRSVFEQSPREGRAARWA